MTPAGELREMRRRIVAGARPFFAFAQANLSARAVWMLERAFTPATASAHGAADQWAATGADADAKAALQMTRVVGSDRQLWETIEAMQVWEVTARLDRAILKSM